MNLISCSVEVYCHKHRRQTFYLCLCLTCITEFMHSPTTHKTLFYLICLIICPSRLTCSTLSPTIVPSLIGVSSPYKVLTYTCREWPLMFHMPTPPHECPIKPVLERMCWYLAGLHSAYRHGWHLSWYIHECLWLEHTWAVLMIKLHARPL